MRELRESETTSLLFAAAQTPTSPITPHSAVCSASEVSRGEVEGGVRAHLDEISANLLPVENPEDVREPRTPRLLVTTTADASSQTDSRPV